MGSFLITGGAKRNGRNLALKLAQRGEQVLITYNNSVSADLQELQQAGVSCIKTDLTDTLQLNNLVEQIKGEFSDLSAIIHNASQWLPNTFNTENFAKENTSKNRLAFRGKDEQFSQDFSFLTEELQNFELMYRLHMQAPFALNLALAEVLIKNSSKHQGGANIIHFTDAVVTKPAKNHIAYAASKAGLEHMTKSFARALAPHVRVNSIAPALLAFNTADDEEYRQKAKAKSLLPPAQGFDVAWQAVEYLLNNSYVTGTCLTLDGGRNCL